MSVVSRHPSPIFASPEWEAGVLQLLEESHVVATAKQPGLRVPFAVSLGRFLQRQRHMEVCHFYGRFITDLESFCYQLERAVPGPTLERRVDGARGVAGLLRARSERAGHAASRFRFYIWHDADVLLHADPRLFGSIADAIAGVAAEAEYVTEDMLMIQRGIFVGGPSLEMYHQDERGQFRSWRRDSFEQPFWEVVTGLARPSFAHYSIDRLCLAVSA